MKYLHQRFLLKNVSKVVPHQSIINHSKEKKEKSFLESLDLVRLWAEMKANEEMSPYHLDCAYIV